MKILRTYRGVVESYVVFSFEKCCAHFQKIALLGPREGGSRHAVGVVVAALLLYCSGAQSAAIDCILGRDPQVWVPHQPPPLASVLAEADIAPGPSRLG